jgi:AcrR family transcriptional regulator
MTDTAADQTQSRPRQVRKKPAARIEEILRVAAEVFVDLGYAGFNLREVASRVGVRLNAVQYYFPTREKLLDATLERVAKAWISEFQSIAEDHGRPPERRLEALFALNLELMAAQQTAPLMFEIFAMAQHEAFARELVRRNYNIYRGIFEDILRELAPACPSERIVATAALITSQMEGLVLFLRPGDATAPTPQSVADQFGALAALYVEMIRAGL